MTTHAALMEMSPNMQESDTGPRKRSHDEFADDVVRLGGEQEAKRAAHASIQPSGDTLVPPPRHLTNPQSSPQGSPALTETGTSTPAHNSPSPQTPSNPTTQQTDDQNTSSSLKPAPKPASMANQAHKRKRLTPAEKEAREKEAAERKKEREEKAATRAAEHARLEEEKAARAKEREEKKKQKEEEDRVKAQEREEKRKRKEEEDKIKVQKAQERDEKKRKKEEEQRLVQEAKEKEARKQPKLKSFFGAPRTPKKPAPTGPMANESPRKDGAEAASSAAQESEYRKLFKPFFVKEGTSLASPATQMDDETRETKSAILDQYISGERTYDMPTGTFDAVQLFTLPAKPSRRGRLHHPVKLIMEDVYKGTESVGADGANKLMAGAREKLAKIPIKVISFSQDVRPPYRGTATLKPYALGKDHMRRQARRSMSRRLPLEYDYDSEAEWQDDEGEDLDVDDDEEEIDDEDDMEGFLDDSEDAGPSRRILINTMEPECSGICFENGDRKGPNPAVYNHKMEFIIGNHDGSSAGIDPWSTAYWQPDPKPVPESGAMPPPPAPANAFAALTGGAPAVPTKTVKPEILNDVKQAILKNKSLSKAGIIDFIFQQFRDNASRTEVKNTIEMVAEKSGSGRMKEWCLKPGHEIAV